MNSLNDLHKISNSFPNTDKMPLLFLGHGNPMNAIEENQFVAGFRNLAKTLPQPNAILCISAHWYTRGTKVTAMEMPKTIHDFGGFSKELFEVQYPAKGSPILAKETKALLLPTFVELDEKWGLDHGAWSVIKHLYPNADVPVIQLSIDYTKSGQYHFELAQKLEAAGVRVMLDDRRDASPGVKFKDAELLGMPTIVVVGKGLADGVVEVRDRATGERSNVAVGEAAQHIAHICKSGT